LRQGRSEHPSWGCAPRYPPSHADAPAATPSPRSTSSHSPKCPPPRHSLHRCSSRSPTVTRRCFVPAMPPRHDENPAPGRRVPILSTEWQHRLINAATSPGSELLEDLRGWTTRQARAPRTNSELCPRRQRASTHLPGGPDRFPRSSEQAAPPTGEISGYEQVKRQLPRQGHPSIPRHSLTSDKVATLPAGRRNPST